MPRPRTRPPRSDSLAALGQAIELVMSKAGMTQEDVADRAGMKIEQVGRLVRGQNDPRLDTLKRLCVGLPVTLGELVILTEKLEKN